jgi:hypothetical protein
MQFDGAVVFIVSWGASCLLESIVINEYQLKKSQLRVTWNRDTH